MTAVSRHAIVEPASKAGKGGMGETATARACASLCCGRDRAGGAWRGISMLHPKLISFDVFGTLISVRDSSYGAFERILSEVRAHQIDVRAFWEHWEHRNIAHYWDPYRSYREICELSLSETFSHFNLVGDCRLIGLYFEAFPRFILYDDVARTLD